MRWILNFFSSLKRRLGFSGNSDAKIKLITTDDLGSDNLSLDAELKTEKKFYVNQIKNGLGYLRRIGVERSLFNDLLIPCHTGKVIPGNYKINFRSESETVIVTRPESETVIVTRPHIFRDRLFLLQEAGLIDSNNIPDVEELGMEKINALNSINILLFKALLDLCKESDDKVQGLTRLLDNCHALFGGPIPAINIMAVALLCKSGRLELHGDCDVRDMFIDGKINGVALTDFLYSSCFEKIELTDADGNVQKEAKDLLLELDLDDENNPRTTLRNISILALASMCIKEHNGVTH